MVAVRGHGPVARGERNVDNPSLSAIITRHKCYKVHKGGQRDVEPWSYSDRMKSPRSQSFRPIQWWMALVGVLAGLAVTAGIYWWLDTASAGADDAARLRVDVIRTSLTVGAGMGGAAALLLALRRQWLQEHDQQHRERLADDDRRHRERVAKDSEVDARERRVTELYVQAVEQLGSDRAPVRLGGLYALDRLGHGNPEHRQTIIEVICAYLRMPYLPAVEPKPSDLEEYQVRQAAQRILATRSRPRPGEDPVRPSAGSRYWGRHRIDLSGAQLEDFDLTGCHVLTADFTGAVFHGDTRLAGVHAETADFRGATFLGDAQLVEAVCAVVSFTGAAFRRRADLQHIRVGAEAKFDHADFEGTAVFRHAKLPDMVGFMETRFRAAADFVSASFAGDTFFVDTTFDDTADLRSTEFRGEANFILSGFAGFADFGDAHFLGPADWSHVRFGDGARFAGTRFDDKVFFDVTKVRNVQTARYLLPPNWTITESGPDAGDGELSLTESPVR